MIHKAAGTLLILVLLMAGSGPVAATAHASGTVHSVGPETGPNPAVGAGSAQVGTENCSFPVTATDATGTNVTVESTPQRIVSLQPSAAQTLWEIGAKDRVVGVSQYATYLDGADELTNVSGAGQQFVNTEKVVGLDPDLVLAPNTIPNETVETLRNAGVTVYRFGFGESFEGIYAKTNLTGRFVGACGGADRIVSAMQTRVGAVRQAVGNESTPGAFYLLGGGFVAGNGTFIGDVVETAGAENLAASAEIQDYKEVSPEVVANQDPQWIVTSDRLMIPDGAPWAGTTAVEENQTIVVNNSYINEPAPRVVLPLTKIARKLHPEAMQSANISKTPIGSASLDMGNATTQPTANGSNATGNRETTVATTQGIEATVATESTATGASVNGTMSGSQTTTDGTTDVSGGAMTAETNQSGNATDGSGGNSSTETSSSNGPGFGVVAAAIALLGGASLARRRS